jgi:hypothetical protein
MRVIATAKYVKKLAEKKKDWDPNPWAVCHTTVDKKKDPDKYERCVHHVKDKQKDCSKPAMEGTTYTPEKEDEWVAKSRYKKPRKSRLPIHNIEPDQYTDADWRRLVRKHMKSKNVVIEAKKKWMQDAVKKPGAFTEYCGGDVTEECIQRGKNSPDTKTRQRANLADTFRSVNKKKKKDKSKSCH